MDYREKTTNLIKAYHLFKRDSNSAIFIKEACNFFEFIKTNILTENEKQFLYFIANSAGLPQYYDMLKQKTDVDISNLMTIGAVINDCSLFTDVESDTKLHRYQKEVLDHFKVGKDNRYLLSAPTSFGKTFLVYEIIRKMKYSNILLIFPTISLLSENYQKLLNDEQYSNFKIHTLSDVNEIGDKNIWVYTPERFLSFIDKHKDQLFDFSFIDEIYKIDNDYIIDKDTIEENERDTAYRIALEYTCRNSKDVLLAGPYMEISNNIQNNSLSNFMQDKKFMPLNYNKIEIVDKEIIGIKGKLEYKLGNIDIKMHNKGKHGKIADILNAITTTTNNSIVYQNYRNATESYAKKIIPLLKLPKIEHASLFNYFTEHLEKRYGEEWVVIKALKNNIGIHHGLIPKYIQKQIIEFFNSGQLYILISTTTITEGVNTTAKNIIICSAKKGRKALKHFDAMNIAGRAGRFSHHYTGRVIFLDKDFEKIYLEAEDILKHKNFDEKTNKNEIDYLITEEKYLKKEEKQDKESMYDEIKKRKIPIEYIEQFKVIGIRDKLKIFDRIKMLTDTEKTTINKLIKKINYNTVSIDWAGFQLVLDIISPIINDNKLMFLIETKCKTQNQCSIITALTYFYLKDGYFGMLKYRKKIGETLDEAIKRTSETVYGIFKYQLVKYLGIFDLMYKCAISITSNKAIEEITGITRLIKKLEYSALSENARILNDYGVPYAIIEYYEKNDTNLAKNFDQYEEHIDSKIGTLLR